MSAALSACVIEPSSASAYIELAKILPGAARELFTRALRLSPELAVAHFGLATALQQGGDAPASGLQLMRAIAVSPNFAGAYSNFSLLFEAAEQLGNARALADRAAICVPLTPLLHANRASLLEKSDQPAQAILAYKKSLILHPGFASAAGDFAITLSKAGQLDEAKSWFLRALALNPGDVRFYGQFLELDDAGALPEVRAALEEVMRKRDDLSVEDRIDGHFALGKALADSGDAAGAFSEWRAANEMMRQTQICDEEAALRQFSLIKARFSQAYLSEAEKSGLSSDLPVFIVGMPRCGSSMVEQIIASHPDAAGAGEIGDFVKLAEAAGLSNALVEDSSSDSLAALGKDYLANLQRTAPAKSRITDKMLSNFLWLGVIRLALPRARIIHVKRDAIDSCMSNYSRRFFTPLPYASDLGRLGRYYRAYSELMEHWRGVISEEHLLEVQYEDITADPKAQIGRILDFIDLPWDDRCLDFHRTERLVQTASRVQVKRPLYKTSVGRWHPYLPYLRQLLEALGPVAGER